jgi:hypothetical protein
VLVREALIVEKGVPQADVFVYSKPYFAKSGKGHPQYAERFSIVLFLSDTHPTPYILSAREIPSSHDTRT